MSSSLIQRIAMAMERIAPLRLADSSWDNVGILVENPRPNGSNIVMLTIDLTPAVLKECLDKGVEVIVAYHPPIFAPMKKLTLQNTKQEIILTTIASGMSIFSPHTSLDAAEGGMNDWLASVLGASERSSPIQPTEGKDGSLSSTTGMGRHVTLTQTVPLNELAMRIKSGLGIPTVRVSLPQGWEPTRPVRSIALCAGSGSSVFRSLRRPVDVLLSGEMGHHDVLAANDKGQAVILCEHTNSERGFLQQVLVGALRRELSDSPNIDIIVSTCDADPLVVW